MSAGAPLSLRAIPLELYLYRQQRDGQEPTRITLSPATCDALLAEWAGTPRRGTSVSRSGWRSSLTRPYGPTSSASPDPNEQPMGFPSWLFTDPEFTRTVWAQIVDKLALGLVVAWVGWKAAQRFERYKSRETLRLELARRRMAEMEQIISSMHEQKRLLQRIASDLEQLHQMEDTPPEPGSGFVAVYAHNNLTGDKRSQLLHTLDELSASTERVSSAVSAHVGLLGERVGSRLVETYQQIALTTGTAREATWRKAPASSVVTAANAIAPPEMEELVDLV